MHLHSQRVTLDGGVVIDMTAVDKHDPVSWCEFQGVDVEDGTVVVYKVVNAQLRSGHGLLYPIGETVTDAKWAATDACGAGLHFGSTPTHAEAHFNGDGKPRFLACRVKISEMVGISGGPLDTAKCKARSCEVLYEVDVHGREIAAVQA